MIWFKYEIVQKQKNTFTFELTCYPKKASNKSFSVSNFGQKSPGGHMSIFPQNGARGSKDDMV